MEVAKRYKEERRDSANVVSLLSDDIKVAKGAGMEGGRKGGRKGARRKPSMSSSSPVACRSQREGRHDTTQVERGSGGGGESEESVTSAAGVRFEERDNRDR